MCASVSNWLDGFEFLIPEYNGGCLNSQLFIQIGWFRILPYLSVIRMEFIIVSRYSTGHGFQLFLQVLFDQLCTVVGHVLD